MKKPIAIILTVIVISLIIFIIVFLAIKFDWFKKEEVQETKYTKIMLRAKDYQSQEDLKASYILEDEFGSELKKGNLSVEWEELTVGQFKNYSLIISGENYYTNQQDIQIFDTGKRITIYLEKYANLSMTHEHYKNLNKINLNLKVDGTLKNFYIGLRWSFDIQDIEIERFNKFYELDNLREKSPRIYVELFKLYETNLTLTDIEYTFPINYSLLNPLDEWDNIEITVVDSDLLKVIGEWQYEISTLDGRDLAIPDLKYKITGLK